MPEISQNTYEIRSSKCITANKKMAEPRLTIRNVATENILYVGRSWTAITTSENEAGNQDAKFKVQWCKRTSHGIATTVLIRTDKHPQALLDARDLRYQGWALDSQKCYNKNRWWKLTWLEVARDGKPTVLIRSYTKGTYLAEKKYGAGVELISLREDASLKDLPDKAKWELTIGGRALSPRQATLLGVGIPVAAVAGTFTGGAAIAGAAGPMAACFAASGATTLAGIVGTTGAIATGAVMGGVSAVSTTVICNVLKNVSNTLFVDW